MIKGLKTGFWFGFWTLFFLSATAAAAHAASTRASLERTETEEPSKLYLSAAVNQGTSSLSNPVAGSTGTSGSRTELLLLASVDLGSFVIEGGGGWLHDRLAGQAAPSTFGPTDYELVTDAGVAELSPRYRVVGGLELGPLAELLFGADVSFVPGFGDSGQHTAWLGGAQALYEFRLSGAAVRAGARYLRSLDIASHTLQSVQATLQFGLPIL
jgi:hypothetical protein